MTLLHLELPSDKKDVEEMQFKLKGNHVTISKMIATAMDTNADISTLFVTAVLGWAHENNVPFEMLKEIYNRHKP